MPVNCSSARDGPPDAAAAQGVAYTASVSAADTLKITPKNLTAGAIDPLSGTWRGVAVEYA